MVRFLLIALFLVFPVVGYSFSDIRTSVELTDSVFFRKYENIIAGRNEKLTNIQSEIDKLHAQITGKDSISDLEIYNAIGDLYSSVCNFSGEIDSYIKANVIAQKIGIPPDIKRINRLGTIYKVQGYYEKALVQHNLAFSLAKEADDESGMLESEYYIGIANREIGKMQLAVELIFDVLKKAEEQGNIKFMALANNSIGLIYQYADNQNVALDYFLRSLKLFESINDSTRISILHNNIGIALTELGEYNKARSNYFKSLEIDFDRISILRISRNFANLAEIHIKLKEFDKVSEYLDKSLYLSQKMNSALGIAYSYYINGLYYRELKEYNKALDYFQKSYQINKKIKRKTYELYASEMISEMHFRIDNYEEAYKYQQISHQLETQIRGNKTLAILALAQRQYNHEKEEKIKQLQREKEYITYCIVIIISALLLILTVFLAIRLRKRFLKNRAIRYKIEKEKGKLEHSLYERNVQLDSNSIQLISKKQLIKKMTEKLLTFSKELNEGQKKLIQNIISELRHNLDKNIGDEYETIFKNTHQDFFRKLNSRHPYLTPNEIKLSSLLSLNLTTKEISEITKQSQQSIIVARSRLRKKLNLPEDENMNNYLIGISSSSLRE